MWHPSFRSFYLALCILLVVTASATVLPAGEKPQQQTGILWDAAVNDLLATGMYGFDAQRLPGLTMQLQHSDNLYRGLAPEKARIDGQAITFSYEGSSGLLGFSAGYILTNQQDSTGQGSVFLGLTPEQNKKFDPARSWYMAMDLSRTYQVDEDISLNLGNKTMLLNNPFDTEVGEIFSVLFNMPISYKNYITITPELQWSRPVYQNRTTSGSTGAGYSAGNSPQDVLYGGVSISFSY